MKTIIYSIYLASKTQERTYGTYKFSFVLYLSLLFLFHIFPLSLLLNLVFPQRIELFKLFNNISPNICGGIFWGIIILFNYIFFIKMDKLQDIVKQFQNKRFVNKYWFLIILLYVILLFVLMILEREYFKSK